MINYFWISLRSVSCLVSACCSRPVPRAVTLSHATMFSPLALLNGKQFLSHELQDDVHYRACHRPNKVAANSKRLCLFFMISWTAVPASDLLSDLPTRKDASYGDQTRESMMVTDSRSDVPAALKSMMFNHPKIPAAQNDR